MKSGTPGLGVASGALRIHFIKFHVGVFAAACPMLTLVGARRVHGVTDSDALFLDK